MLRHDDMIYEQHSVAGRQAGRQANRQTAWQAKLRKVGYPQSNIHTRKEKGYLKKYLVVKLHSIKRCQKIFSKSFDNTWVVQLF